MDSIQSRLLNQTKRLPVVALRGTSVFPATEMSLQVGRPRSGGAVQAALAAEGIMVVVAQKNARIEVPTSEDLFTVGTLVAIKQVSRETDGVLVLAVEGLQRVRLCELVETKPHLEALVEPVSENGPVTSETAALARSVRERYDEVLLLSKGVRGEGSLPDVDEGIPGTMADLIAANLALSLEDRQTLLEAAAVDHRLEKLMRILQRETEILRLEKKIQERVRHQVEKTQREYFLREQMRAIQRELGEDTELSETEQMRERIKTSGMTAEAEEKALREIARLEKMPSHAAESVVVRNYVDWLVNLPWKEITEDRLDLAAAEQVLNEDHYGLEKVKERILEFLAVRKLVEDHKGPILCFVGPPGVGKTSLARSIASALNRNFVRVSLGGMRDEAEIRGHRRTYIGSMPGRIIQGMRQAASKNPVFLLDEVDKINLDFRGDPAAALLEVLDVEHNNSFSDHFIEVGFDLSQVLFITTANTLYSVPQPLADRMETIFISGYTEEDKVEIVRRHLLPRQLAAHGLGKNDVTFSDEALKVMIRRYTREAGVRQFERKLAAVLRKIARRTAAGEVDHRPVRVTVANLETFLGLPRFRHGLAEAEHQVGACTGLGWTEYGGDIILIEVSVMPGKGNLYLTGKLGEVMRESAQAALSFIRTRTDRLGIKPGFSEMCDLHVHVPEGAVSKDGPSAGITMATAMISALSGMPVRSDTALTGEITLRGRVLSVGGIKEKALAAHRAGIKVLVLPEDNRRDLKEIPDTVKKRLDFRFVRTMDEVLSLSLLGREEELQVQDGLH